MSIVHLTCGDAHVTIIQPIHNSHTKSFTVGTKVRDKYHPEYGTGVVRKVLDNRWDVRYGHRWLSWLFGYRYESYFSTFMLEKVSEHGRN